MKFPGTKIVLSLATPRMDRDDWNIKGELINAMLKHNFGKSEKIFFCDNSNLAEQGKPIERLFERYGIHLSRDETAVLASNMKKTIDTVCKTPYRGNEQGIRYRNNGYRNRTAGNYRGHYGNNRSSYGQSENYNRHQMNVYERRGPYQRTGHGGIWR